MRPLWMFLVKYYFVLLFLLLEGLSFYIFISHTFYQRAVVMNATNSIAGRLYEIRSSLNEYMNLKQANEHLAQEYANLLARKQKAPAAGDSLFTNVNDTSVTLQHEFITARVINNTLRRKGNYLTLDKGYTDGVRKEMAVICPGGVVGIVIDASAHFSSVMSLLHYKTMISAKIKKNNYVGTVVWDKEECHITEAILKDIPLHVKLAAGDTVVTSGYSLIFPEGVMLGTVYSYSMNDVKDFYRIKIRLSTDFSSIRHVYVVKNLMQEELKQLDAGEQEE